VGSAVINCGDMGSMTRFWTAALDLVPSTTEPNDEFRRLEGGPINISLQRARTPVTARDQMHLDLYSDEMEAQVTRLVELGAAYARRGRDEGGEYVVLTDPEGNEFCVCQKDRL
jgi:predicted enzyme related to lactoylglutathione lyase